MNGQRSALQHIINAVTLFILVFLAASCSESGTGIGDGPGTNQPSADIPPNLISTADTSITVDAVNRGLDLEFDLIRTRFFCYYNADNDGLRLTNFAIPHGTMDLVGNAYNITPQF